MNYLEVSLAIYRHAKSREPGNLVPGHFLRKIRTFFRNQSFEDYLSKFCFYIWETQVDMNTNFAIIITKTPRYWLSHPWIFMIFSNEFPDIFKPKVWFPDKNKLFACLYLKLSGTIWYYLGLSGNIWDCLRLSPTRVQVEAGESKLLHFWNFLCDLLRQTDRQTHVRIIEELALLRRNSK